ncbi:Cof-type HAD-IIB family hydrolase [Kocuria palustris]|uniref:Cof-type HAD-IIB family hydrolase n=1 Tax=Kocuria palustris TaxID=71999 RepID=UPI0011A48E09|nr:Cof-type HAD-IIB family hydrolase [Kocuria palustris]
MTFRLVAFDIDGTLLGSDRQLQPGTRLGLQAIRESGAQIMLASGRPIPGLRELAGQLEIGQDLVLAGMNGSIIVDQASGEVIARREIDEPTAQEMIDRVLARGLIVMIPLGEDLFVSDPEHPQVHHEATGNALTVHPLPRVADLPEPPTKLLFTGERPDLLELQKEFDADFADRAECTFSSPIYYEATAPGVDKSSAIADYCAAREIPLEQVMAFGDNGNDVTMLRTAGLGVAMGNGIPEAQEAADVVTATNDDEGIARILEQHFPFSLAEVDAQDERREEHTDTPHPTARS